MEKSNNIVISEQTSKIYGDLNQDAKVVEPITLNRTGLPSMRPAVGYSDCEANNENEEKECKSLNSIGISDQFFKDEIKCPKNYVDDDAVAVALLTRVSTGIIKLL